MKKYPVISAEGNEYEVEIKYSAELYNFGMNVYIRKKRRGVFGILKAKELRKYNRYGFEEETLSKYGSYVNVAKHFVREYEKELAEDKELMRKHTASLREFEEWDGIID